MGCTTLRSTHLSFIIFLIRVRVVYNTVTVSYLWMTNKLHQVHCALLMGKARVDLIKPFTIRRLELTVVTAAVRMDRMMCEELKLPFKPSLFWTDSTLVIKYIKNETSRFDSHCWGSWGRCAYSTCTAVERNIDTINRIFLQYSQWYRLWLGYSLYDTH